MPVRSWKLKFHSHLKSPFADLYLHPTLFCQLSMIPIKIPIKEKEIHNNTKQYVKAGKHEKPVHKVNGCRGDFVDYIVINVDIMKCLVLLLLRCDVC